MHRLGCLARVAGVGGVVSAASLLSNRQERPGDSEIRGQRGVQPLHRRLVTNVSVPWGDNMVPNNVSDNVSEEQEDEADEVEDELEVMAESVTKPNELSKQQAQAEKLKGAISKVNPRSKCLFSNHICMFKGPESGLVQDV